MRWPGRWPPGVANLMRHGRRHAAHGRQLFSAQPGFHLAQVVQKHHAHPFGAAVLIAGGGGEPGAHVQAHGAFARMEKGHVGSLGLLFVEGAVGQCDQRLPASQFPSEKGSAVFCPSPAKPVQQGWPCARCRARPPPAHPSFKCSITRVLICVCTCAFMRLRSATSCSPTSLAESWCTR